MVHKIVYTLLAVMMISSLLHAQEMKSLTIKEAPVLIHKENRGTKVEVNNINVSTILTQLKNCPVAHDVSKAPERGQITLPIANNDITFDIVENNTMSAAFKKAAPEIRTYTMDANGLRGRLTVAPTGIHAYLFSDQGITAIYPTVPGSPTKHTIEYGIVMEEGQEGIFECSQNEIAEPINITPELKSAMADVSNGDETRTYRFAVVCTGEFWEANGASTTAVRGVVTATTDALNEIYMRDASLMFQLLTPVLYANSATDPFIPDTGMNVPGRTTQAGVEVLNVFSASSFDIGHVFHKHSSGDGWSSGGIAQLRSVCNDNINNGRIAKASGWSGSFNNTGVGWIQLAGHEIGHMFDCPHTFNGTGGSCTDNISLSTAYEIASGTTIMSYNGICESGQNIPQSGNLDSYFHANSLLRIINHIRNTGDCAAKVNNGNTPPEINADPCGHNGGFTIPKNTPFILKGEAVDADGDLLEYSWEQYDEDGSNIKPTQGFIGTQAAGSNLAPLFRCYPPSTVGDVRYFPRLAAVMTGQVDDYDVLPRVPRDLNFQFVVRDNNPAGGGVALEQITVPVSSAGPLRVTEPGVNDQFTAGQDMLIEWSTSSSDDLCDKVEIRLSTDDGLTFPYVLASDVDYTAKSLMITLPANAPNTRDGKVMIKCVDSECVQFYNVNTGNIRIDSDCESVGLTICSDEPVSLDLGDPGLDLDVELFAGQSFTSKSVGFNTTDPNYLPAAVDRNTGVCSNAFTKFYNTFRITTETSGTYRIFVGNWDQFLGISVHTKDFDPADPCATILGTNYLPGSVSNNLSFDLEACEEYVMVFDATNPGRTVFIEQLQGPGPLFEIEDEDPNYAKTFIAVDENGIIVTETPTADFTSTVAGKHIVYGVQYKASGPEPPNNVNPSDWVGQSLSDIYNSGACFTLTKEKSLEIISSCIITDVSAGTPSACNPEDNTYSQMITVTHELAPSGNIIVQGQSFAVTTSPQTVELTGLESDGSDVTVEVSFEESPACTFTAENLYKAPENCCPLSLDLPDEINRCLDEMVTLDAGSDGDTYQWTLDGSPLTDMDNEVEANTSGLYAVTVTTANGCAKPDEVQVTFFDNPLAELSAADTSGCDGETLTIDLETDMGTIAWFKDGTEIMGETMNTLDVTEGGLYSAVVTNIANCVSDASQQINFSPTPQVELGDDLDICANDPLTLDAGNDGLGYVWFRNGSVIIGEVGNTLDVDQSGMYSVSVDGEGECDVQDMINVEIFELPEAEIGGDTAICAGTPVRLFTNPINVSEFEFTKDGTDLGLTSINVIDITEGGLYELTIRNEINCEVVQSITVVENDLPVVDLEDEKIGCEGSDVLLEAPIMGGAYQWLFNGSVISTDPTVRVTDAGEYQLVVADDFGCEGSDQIMVSFVPGPSLSIDGAQNICAGDVVMLDATTSGNNIQWSKDGTEIAGATELTLEVTESGVYKASVESATGCVVEDQVTIEVFENPTVEAGGAIVLCDGIMETVTPTSMGNGLSFTWNRNGQFFANTETIDITQEGEYEIIVTNINNCTASDVFTVSISDLPTLSTSTNSIDICDGIAQDVSIMTNATRIEWYLDGAIIPGETGSTLGIASEGMYEAVVYNDEDCSSSVTINATSRPSPQVELGDDIILCPNEMITLDAQAMGSYEWSDNSTDQTVVISNPNLNTTSDVNYSVSVTNSFNCTATDEVTITFRPIISADVSADDGVCEGESVSITATGGLTYQWDDPNGSLSDTDMATTTASPAQTTTYMVTVSDDCPDNEDVVSVTIEVFPPADIDAGLDTIVVLGRTIDLAASGGQSYSWSDDMSNTTFESSTTGSSVTVAPTELTIYTVVGTDANGCMGTDMVSVAVNDNPLEALEVVNVITPNGDGDNDFLEFIGLESEPENELFIYNRWGNLIFSAQNYQSIGALWDGTRAGEPLPADTYYYVLKFGDTVHKSAITIVRD